MRWLHLTTAWVVAAAAWAAGPPPGGPVAFPTPSTHQVEWEAHRTLPAGPTSVGAYVLPLAPLSIEATRELTHTVYGFLPTWVASDLTHLRWDLLSHVCYFSVGLAADGSITNNSGSYSWPSGAYVQALLATAHANGVKVALAATNFTSSEITTLLSSPSNRQNAIDNLLALVQSGSGDGVNIDLEGVPAAQNANLVTFMEDLTAAFHAAIPGSHVSLDTPAVDWSSAFDYEALALACDGLFIMAYDYHWSTAPTAGPVSPLTGGGVWGPYNVTWTVNDYLSDAGAHRERIILGLPYYGFDWPTTSTSVPSSTTGSGTSRTYNAARAAAATHGRSWDAASQTPYYVYTSGQAHQGWYDDAESLGLKWDLVLAENLGGTGMWALNYDTADEELWNGLAARFATPGSLSGVRIGIDPGHGGTDPGAVGPTGLEEADVNLATSLMLRDALLAEGAACYLTRTTDTTVSLTARTDYFNSIPVDRAESCHYNASGTPSANYTGVHIYDDGTGTCPASASSKDMAAKTALRLDGALLIGVVSSNCGIHGVHGDDFHMVRETTMPAMLTEASFISNPTEESLLSTDARRCTIAGAIANGIEDHYGVAAPAPPCAEPPIGTCAAPIPIDTFPYTDSGTTSGKGTALDGYSCPPSSGSEAGPEVVYEVTVPAAGTLTVTVTDGTGVDIDPHLLSACDPSTCLARNDTTFAVHLPAGSTTLVCDTWTSSGGTQYPGAYTLNVAFVPDAPAATLTGVTPASGPTAGGTEVTLSGGSFATGASVAFGSSPATDVVVVNDNTMTARTPSHAVGLVDVSVTNPGAPAATLPEAFSYGDLVGSGLAVDRVASGSTTGNLNGVLEPGERVIVAPTWTNVSAAEVSRTGAVTSWSGPTGGTYEAPDPGAAYGPLAPGASGSCEPTTGDCYEVTVTAGARPLLHWDAALAETLSSGEVTTWQVHIGASFTDVPVTGIFYTFVETLLHSGITLGCTSTMFCPTSTVLRAEMAIFLARALAGDDVAVPTSGTVAGRGDYDCVAGGSSVFLDVAPTALYCRHVHLLAAEGVTLGCATPDSYCPADPVNRASMAMFVARAVAGGDEVVPLAYADPTSGLSYDCDPASANLTFVDVAAADPWCRHVHYLWAREVIHGCEADPPRFCPSWEVTRDQTAKFLANGFGLTLD